MSRGTPAPLFRPPHGDLALTLYRPLEAPRGSLRAKVFRAGAPLALSSMLPLFEDMGVEVADERPYEITPSERESVWIYDFGLTYRGEQDLQTDLVREAFQESFIRAWSGDAESDGYNRLVLRAGLNWHETTVLRAIGRYLRQAGTTFSDRYVEQALATNAPLARLLSTWGAGMLFAGMLFLGGASGLSPAGGR